MAGKKGWPCLENVYFVNTYLAKNCLLALYIKFIYVLDFGLIRIIYEDTMKKNNVFWLPSSAAIFQRFRKNVNIEKHL